jgi:hypothetical protein
LHVPLETDLKRTLTKERSAMQVQLDLNFTNYNNYYNIYSHSLPTTTVGPAISEKLKSKEVAMNDIQTCFFPSTLKYRIIR